MENRIIDIETALAHHEEQISQMSDVITGQWKQIEALKLQVKKLNDIISRSNEAGDKGDAHLSVSERAAIDKPPHY